MSDHNTQAMPAPQAQHRSARTLQASIWIGSICLASAVVWLFRDNAGGLAGLGYLGIFFLSVAGSLTLLLPLPVLPAMLLLGAALEPWGVAVTASAGMTLGMLPSFAAGRSGARSLGQAVQAKRGFFSRSVLAMRVWFSRHQLLGPFLVAAVPFPVLFEFSGFAAGASAVRSINYFSATLVGRFFFALIFTLPGYYGLRWFGG